ncbi:adenylate kinase 8 [Andrena cerasifolii]|uniref:adenylate kinase 8 n=1 Tax=Andrena cerasifolii TaxID=2819439 RepID=UPI004037F76D
MSGSQEVDQRMRAINARAVAYLEKHRIYELFHEIATQLVIQRPDDHLAFIKQYLYVAAKRLDVPKIILIAPPSFDRVALAEILREELSVRPLSLRDLRHTYDKGDDTCHCDESEDLALAMRKILESGALHECGWILVDLPRTKKEARVFQRLGIIPTHVIELILSNEQENWKNICADMGCYQTCDPTNGSTGSQERRYLKNLAGLREVYANYLIEIEVGIRSIEELGKDCAKLTKTVKKHCGAPSLFRIVLVGSRGSGCTSLAKYLSERFNLVHIDYDYIAEQARLQQNPLGEMLRLFEYRWGERPKPEIRIQIVEKYISGYECVKRGWVLTGFPKSVEDFKLLDLSPTPPNRVFFVEVHGDVCRERLLNRRYNIVTGSKHNVATKEYIDTDECKFGIHPRDYRLVVERDVQEYDENATEMMLYAGETAVKIDGNEEEKVVQEKVEASLMCPAPDSQPRVPRPPPEIDPMDIEFEPDDEPDLSVNEPRGPQLKYTFV